MEYIYSCFQRYKNYKNLPRDTRVIAENKVAPFSGHGVVCVNAVHLVSPLQFMDICSESSGNHWLSWMK